MRVPQLMLLLAALGGAPSALLGQQPTQAADSLARQVHALQQRLDSLERILSRMPGPKADTARPPQDELAALQAAAAAAAGRTDTARADTAAPQQFVGRERNLAQLNPEISVTGDVRAYGRSPGPQRNSFDPHEFEVGFQSALDPYSHTKIFVSLANGEVDIEEGYAYWIGLPGHIRLDAGKFRQQIGELNRWHLHALPETEYPLALTTYTGDEGLAATGVSAYWAGPSSGALGVHEFWAQVTRGTNDSLFENGGRPAYLLHVNNFWQVSRAAYFQIGSTGVYGKNGDADVRTRLGGLDFRLTWRPPAQALYREWTIRGELYALRKERAGSGDTRLGGYVGTTYKLGRRWIAGLHYHYVQSPEGPSSTVRQVIPSLTFWQSEWVYLRGQYRYQESDLTGTTHQIAFQAVWAIGPHKHEIY